MNSDDPPVVVEQACRASREQVWEAITEPEQMRQWFFAEIPDFKPEVGFQTGFDVRSGDRVFPHRWAVTEVAPAARLQYDWSYEGYVGDSFVTFELLDVDGDPNANLLRLTHVVRESFAADVPEFERDGCVAGWEYFIQGELKKFLESPSA